MSCPATNGLRGDVTVPATTVTPAPTRVVSVRVTGTFPGAPAHPQAWLLASLDNTTWAAADVGNANGAPAQLTANRNVLTWANLSQQTLHLCLVATTEGPLLNVDMVHVDVTETQAN